MGDESARLRAVSFARSADCIYYFAWWSTHAELPKDFGQAEKQFEKILAVAPYRVDDIDVYSNILYVTENRLKLSRLAHEFLELDKDRPEVCCLVGE